MNKSGFLDRVKGLLADLTGKNRFGRLDSGILKTMMMLAAVDGDVAADEIVRFRDVAMHCRGYNGVSFEELWDAALRSAGYILLQARLLGEDALVAAFVCEAEKDFVGEVIQEDTDVRERAFDCLQEMAAADGCCSDIERKCLAALSLRVREARRQAIAERYPRAKVCQ